MHDLVKKFRKQIKHFLKGIKYFLKLCVRKIKFTPLMNSEQIIIRLIAETSVKKMEGMTSSFHRQLRQYGTEAPSCSCTNPSWGMCNGSSLLVSSVCWMCVDVLGSFFWSFLHSGHFIPITEECFLLWQTTLLQLYTAPT